jgi:hypothetical protein
MSKFSELSSTMQYCMDDVQNTAARRLANIQKLQLDLEILENSTIVNYQGGLFNVTPQLISFIGALSQENTMTMANKTMTVLDAYSIPIEIPDLQSFLQLLINSYAAAMKIYSDKYQEFNRK